MFKSLLPWKHMKTKVMAPEQTMDDDPELQQKLVACSTCGRTFLPLPLKKHAPVCEKNATKKRKVFDSLKQRVEGTDLAQFHQKSYLRKKNDEEFITCHHNNNINCSNSLNNKLSEVLVNCNNKPKRPNKWEVNPTNLVTETTDTMPPPQHTRKHLAKLTSPHERCPFCDRNFGPKAYDRHVEWCKEHKARIHPAATVSSEAKERLEARIKYKVPPLNKKLTVREKYSNNATSPTSSGPKIESFNNISNIKNTNTPNLQRTASIRKPRMPLLFENNVKNKETKSKSEQNISHPIDRTGPKKEKPTPNNSVAKKTALPSLKLVPESVHDDFNCISVKKLCKNGNLVKIEPIDLDYMNSAKVENKNLLKKNCQSVKREEIKPTLKIPETCKLPLLPPNWKRVVDEEIVDEISSLNSMKSKFTKRNFKATPAPIVKPDLRGDSDSIESPKKQTNMFMKIAKNVASKISTMAKPKSVINLIKSGDKQPKNWTMLKKQNEATSQKSPPITNFCKAESTIENDFDSIESSLNGITTKSKIQTVVKNAPTVVSKTPQIPQKQTIISNKQSKLLPLLNEKYIDVKLEDNKNLTEHSYLSAKQNQNKVDNWITGERSNAKNDRFENKVENSEVSKIESQHIKQTLKFHSSSNSSIDWKADSSLLIDNNTSGSESPEDISIIMRRINETYISEYENSQSLSQVDDLCSKIKADQKTNFSEVKEEPSYTKSTHFTSCYASNLSENIKMYLNNSDLKKQPNLNDTYTISEDSQEKSTDTSNVFAEMGNDNQTDNNLDDFNKNASASTSYDVDNYQQDQDQSAASQPRNHLEQNMDIQPGVSKSYTIIPASSLCTNEIKARLLTTATKKNCSISKSQVNSNENNTNHFRQNSVGRETSENLQNTSQKLVSNNCVPYIAKEVACSLPKNSEEVKISNEQNSSINIINNNQISKETSNSANQTQQSSESDMDKSKFSADSLPNNCETDSLEDDRISEHISLNASFAEGEVKIDRRLNLDSIQDKAYVSCSKLRSATKFSPDGNFLDFSSCKNNKFLCEILRTTASSKNNFLDEYEVPKKKRRIDSEILHQSHQQPQKFSKTRSNSADMIVCRDTKIKNHWIKIKKSSTASYKRARYAERNMSRVINNRQRFSRSVNELKNQEVIAVNKDLKGAFLKYKNEQGAERTDEPIYDPFESAQRQFMELLESDDFKPTSRPRTTDTTLDNQKSKSALKPIRSAESASIKKRASVIDPPMKFQDNNGELQQKQDQLPIGEDDFEILENFLNQHLYDDVDAFFTQLNQQCNNNNNGNNNNDSNSESKNLRKYSDDVSSIDSCLINENDNLSIPEHLLMGSDYSPASTDITIKNEDDDIDIGEDIDDDDVDHYSVQYDKSISSIEKDVIGSNKGSSGNNKVQSQQKSQRLSRSAKSRKLFNSIDEGKEKNKKKKGVDSKSSSNNNLHGEDKEDNDDVFAVDDKTYEEFKIYEEMYLRDKEPKHTKKNKKNLKNMSYGIPLMSEDDESPPQGRKTSDSAYGRKTSINGKLSPLGRQSSSSSSSDHTAAQKMSKFCHECGNRYPLTTAKFCVECGVRRLVL